MILDVVAAFYSKVAIMMFLPMISTFASLNFIQKGPTAYPDVHFYGVGELAWKV